MLFTNKNDFVVLEVGCVYVGRLFGEPILITKMGNTSLYALEKVKEDIPGFSEILASGTYDEVLEVLYELADKYN